MNASLQHLVDQARQRLRMGWDNLLEPTPNTRNTAMLKEADTFSQHILGYKALLQKYSAALSGFLSSLRTLLNRNLPRTWYRRGFISLLQAMVLASLLSFMMAASIASFYRDKHSVIDQQNKIIQVSHVLIATLHTLYTHQREAVEGTTICTPSRSELSQNFPYRLGGDFEDIDNVQDVVELLQARNEALVMPIDWWLESLSVSKARMKKLERLRAELDSRRQAWHRTWVSKGLGSRVGLGHLPKRAGRAADFDLVQQTEAEDAARAALNELRDLEAVAKSYHEQEGLVFEQLSKLCRDTAFFKSYIAASFIVARDTLQAATLALGACKRPLPGLAGRERENGGNAARAYGRVQYLDDLLEVSKQDQP